MTIFVKAGEWVTCENGHKICQAARDINAGDIQSPDKDWRDWQQMKPQPGTQRPINCTVCGAPWFDDRGIHFEIGGWRET